MTALNQIQNPFPGLRPFKSDESHLFFGRDGQNDELLNRLDRNRFLAVVGISGSGKSSLVRAGLLPIVHGGFMENAGSHWRVAVFRPVNNPVGNLAKALSHPAVLTIQNSLEEDYDISVQNAVIETVLRRGSLGLVEIVKQYRLPKQENLLLVVDQFEELFGFKESAPDEAAVFIKLLLKSIEQKEVPIYVVITMRSEFLGHCAQFRDLPEAINNSQYLIPRMTREEKQEAIVGPIAVGGAEIEPALVSRLLNDVGDRPDQLPILQHALMRTWDYWDKNHREGEPLDLKHYEAIGTMESALSQHAEEAYQELKTVEGNQTICEKLFKLLTHKEEKDRGVRRPTKVSEICSVTKASEREVINIINVFRQPGRTFLMPPIEVSLNANSVIDISHESLMRIWTRLIKWVKEEEQSAELYLRLAKAAALHEEGKAALWRDPELMLTLKWRKENKPNAAWAQRYDSSLDRANSFLEASKEQQKREIKEKEKLRKAKIRRIGIYAIIITIAAVISILFAVWALDSKREADELRKIAETREIYAKKQKDIAVKVRNDFREQRDIAIKEKIRANKEAERAFIAKKEAVESANKEKLAKNEAKRNQEKAEREERKAKKNAAMAQIQGAIAGMNEDNARFGQYLAKAKELAVHSIAEAKRKELKALLALTSYRMDSEAYIDIDQSTREIFDEFDKNTLNKFTGKKELDYAYKKLKNKYNELQKKSKKKLVPLEIFEALRKAYIANNEDSKDILAPAESWALAAIDNNKIVFNNREGKLLLASLQPNSNDSKLPVIVIKNNKEKSDSSGNTMLWASSFVEINDSIYCGTREGSIIYWGKNNWKEKGTLSRHNARILSMAVSKNRNFLFYSVKNKIYRHNIKSNSNDTGKAVIPFEADNFIRALTVIEDAEHSFLLAANEVGNISQHNLFGNLEEKNTLYSDPNSTNPSAFHSIAYHPDKKLLVLGNSSGELLFFPNIDCNYLKFNSKKKIQPYMVDRRHKGIVRILAFSPNGRYLASGGLDGTIMLWYLGEKKADEIARQGPILTIDSKLKILSIAFVLEGKYMIFSEEQYLRICPTRPEVFYKKLCKICREEKWEVTREDLKLYIDETIKPEDIKICSPGKKK